MTEPTRVPLGGITRYRCPLGFCDWALDVPGFGMRPPHQEMEIAMHLRGHSPEDWLPVLRQAEGRLALASEFRIPCPPSPVSLRRPDDLVVRRRADGQSDGWLILNPNAQPGDHVWTGSEWVYRGELHREVIYKWELGEALEVAPELAAEETRRFEAWVQQMRAERNA